MSEADVRTEGGLDVTSVLLLAGGMACYGSATPVSAIVGRSFPSWMGSAARLGVAAAVLVPVWLVVRRRQGDPPVRELARSIGGRDRVLLAGIAVVGTFGFSILMLIGMRHAPGAVGAVVMATTPAVTGAGAVLFLGEHLDRWRATALGLAVVGVTIVNLAGGTGGSGGDRVVLGSALVFGAVCCEAAYSLMGKRLTASLSPLTLVVAAASLAFVAFLPLAVWDAVGFDWSKPTGGEWVAVAWWGAGTMALGSWLWFRGMSRVPAGTAAPFMAVMPVSALVLSYVLLGEAFAWVHVLGMATVLVGLALVIRSGASLH
jgi:drug/metabolite transporter (DMT)-like permease